MNKVLTLLIILLFIAVGCDDSDDSTAETFPLPGAETTSAPNETPPAFAKPDGSHRVSVAAGLAWLSVNASRVAFGLVSAAVQLPLAAIRTQQPSPTIDGNTYTWEASWTNAGVSYALRLEAMGDLESADWTLYATNSAAGLSDYVWMEATTENFESIDVAGNRWRSGTWTLYDPNIAGDDERSLQIDWTWQDGVDVPNISIENLNQTVDGYMDSLSFSVADNTSTWLLHDEAGVPGDVTITWDRTSFAGSATNKEGNTYCWDENFDDITCP